MAANTNPIFIKVPQIQGAVVKDGNTNKDGTGFAVFPFVAGIEGGRIEQIKIAHLGTNEACVLRLFINNGESNATATNNYLIEEINIAAYTNSDTAAQGIITYTFENGLPLPPNYRLMATVSTTLTSGLMVTAFGGDF